MFSVRLYSPQSACPSAYFRLEMSLNFAAGGSLCALSDPALFNRRSNLKGFLLFRASAERGRFLWLGSTLGIAKSYCQAVTIRLTEIGYIRVRIIDLLL